MTKKKPAASRVEDDPVLTLTEAKKWVSARRVTEIECVVPDQAGVARGKIMPASKFFSDPSMGLPSSIFVQTISGEYPDEDEDFSYDPSDGDVELHPDYSTLCLVPWAQDRPRR
jgi:glutamine synthetase